MVPAKPRVSSDSASQQSKRPRSCIRCWTGPVGCILVLLVAAVAGVVILRPGDPVSYPPSMPAGQLPAWPIFNLATRASEFLFQMHRASVPPFLRLREIIYQAWESHVVYFCSTLGLVDAIAPGEENVTCQQVADRVSLSNMQDEVCRIMHAGTEVGLFKRSSTDSFSVTDMGEYLRKDNPNSAKYMIEFLSQVSEISWLNIPNAIRDGKNAFQHRFHKENMWSYLVEHPDLEKSFAHYMRALTLEASHALVAEYDFSRARTICDLGGGVGAALAEILVHNPHLKGYTVDLPSVVSLSGDYFKERGIGDRAQGVGADFFQKMPEMKCDVVLLKNVIHDWPDEPSKAIYRAAKSIMTSPESVVLTLELVLGVRHSGFERFARLLDLEMIAVTHGGRERTVEEYAELMQPAGLHVVRAIPTRSPWSLIEAKGTQG